MTPEDLEALRLKVFSGPDRDLYIYIGVFFVWFAAVESRIALLLAKVLDHKDALAFELLAGGMQPRVKCERLRLACAERGQMGDALSKRLQHFEKKIIPLRHKLAHRLLVMPKPGGPIYLCTDTKMPYEAFGMGQLPDEKPPESIESQKLLEITVWLSWFTEDLSSIHRGKARPKIFEIDHPKSSLPIPPHSDQEVCPSASGRRHAQKQSPAQKRKTAFAKKRRPVAS